MLIFQSNHKWHHNFTSFYGRSKTHSHHSISLVRLNFTLDRKTCFHGNRVSNLFLWRPTLAWPTYLQWRLWASRSSVRRTVTQTETRSDSSLTRVGLRFVFSGKRKGLALAMGELTICCNSSMLFWSGLFQHHTTKQRRLDMNVRLPLQTSTHDNFVEFIVFRFKTMEKLR